MEESFDSFPLSTPELTNSIPINGRKPKNGKQSLKYKEKSHTKRKKKVISDRKFPVPQQLWGGILVDRKLLGQTAEKEKEPDGIRLSPSKGSTTRPKRRNAKQQI